jgi:hypothetical protein
MTGRVMARWKPHGRRLLLGCVTVAFFALFPAMSPAQDQPGTGEPGVPPTAVLTVDPATLVDPATAPQLVGPPLAADALVNRPEIPIDQYRELKRAAGQASAKLTGRQQQEAQPLATTGITGRTGCTQLSIAGSGAPPDSSGAAGNTQIAQALNSKLCVFTKANPPVFQCGFTFATLTGFTTTSLFDPRIVHDDAWDRWVISVEARPESAFVQRQFVLVSTSENACGPYFRYNFDVKLTSDTSEFWDFPDLGLTQDSLIITANRFFGLTNAGSATFGMAKANVYNGLGFRGALFTGLGRTLAPPIVLDGNPCASLLQILDATHLGRRIFCNSGNPIYEFLSAPASILVSTPIAVPANARQPGCSATSSCSLDTSDARFSSQTWQYFDNLWAAHTIAFNPSIGSFLPTPKYYDIDIFGTGINTVKQQAFFFNNSGLPDDFNASIAARPNGTIYVSWNASGPSNFVQVRVGGKVAGCAFSQALVNLSTATLTGNFDPRFGSQRWGDYSNTWLDNSFSTQAWAFAERVNSSSTWGTWLERFAQTC